MGRKTKVSEAAERRGVTEPELLVDLLNSSPTITAAGEKLGVSYVTMWGYMTYYGVEQIIRYRHTEEPEGCPHG